MPIGEVIATGDADLSYPFEILPRLLSLLQKERVDFLTTNRLLFADRQSMKTSHRFGNVVLTQSSRARAQTTLYGFPIRECGCFVVAFSVRSICARAGMAFSQEIKHEAVARGFRCGEVPIDYRPRGGDVKLNPARDGLRNLGQIALHRLRTERPVLRPKCDRPSQLRGRTSPALRVAPLVPDQVPRTAPVDLGDDGLARRLPHCPSTPRNESSREPISWGRRGSYRPLTAQWLR